jgi:hypothetical protein
MTALKKIYIDSAFKYFSFLLLVVIFGCCSQVTDNAAIREWQISIVPSSIRIDPVTSGVIEERFDAVPQNRSGNNLLTENWIYDGRQATLHSARGEYISFQLVLTNNSSKVLEGIVVEMDPFSNRDGHLPVDPELFLEWSVKVITPSGGYPKSSLGTGWYPDALIPFDHIQLTKPPGRWIYPLQLPDFNNRIEDQESLMIWVDQFVPFDREDARPGNYSSEITVKIKGQAKSIPVNLVVWDFAIPKENRFRAALQHEGFVARANENVELQVYQLLRRNRISVMDPVYRPELTVSSAGKVNYEWTEFDNRLIKYFTGEAFTKSYGYEYGPGYGEPVENFLVPFNVYHTKRNTGGWPDTGNPEVERNPENRAIYVSAVSQFRDHILKHIDPGKTMLTAYIDALDEAYYPEAWDRMVYYGDLLNEHFPEVEHRIDGGFTQEAMDVVKHSIDSWASHTIIYDSEDIKQYRDLGIKDWIYGSMIYESRVNSWVGSSTYIDLPLVNERAISWATYKYGTFSWLSWGIGAGWRAAWYDPETWKDYRDDRDERDEQKILNGNGCLLYAPDIIPNVRTACPSIRLKNMRNGVQEYEYLSMLENLTGRDQVMDLVNSIINKPFGRNAIGITDVWSFDPEQWDRLRIHIGNRINELSN